MKLQHIVEAMRPDASNFGEKYNSFPVIASQRLNVIRL